MPDIDLRSIATELRRLNDNLEQFFRAWSSSQPNRYSVVPDNFDPDEHSAVLYPDEFGDLVAQHLGRRVAGIDVGR
jgi:hypothetical protein